MAHHCAGAQVSASSLGKRDELLRSTNSSTRHDYFYRSMRKLSLTSYSLLAPLKPQTSD
jgi:hypothetical protein